MVAGLAAACFARWDLTPEGRLPMLLDGPTGPSPLPLPPSAGAADDAWLLGQAHEALLGRGARRRRGAFYTPAVVASGLVAAVAAGRMLGRVCDPAVGGGAFLLAAAEHAVAAGASPGVVVAERTFGIDVDRLAVEVAEAALVLWATAQGAPRARPSLAVADALQAGLGAWPAPIEPFDVVVGNPPFLGQLVAATARRADDRKALRGQLGAAAGGYVDSAPLFLLAACRMTRPGGRVALLLPESALAARDAGPVREAVRGLGALTGLWHAGEPVFEAGVRVCAPIVEVGAEQGAIDRWLGRDVVPVPPLDGDEVARRLGDEGTRSWAPLVTDLLGVPEVVLGGGPRLGAVATATAGFRDQYYGVQPYVGEATAVVGRRARLVTSGAIDPLRLRLASAAGSGGRASAAESGGRASAAGSGGVDGHAVRFAGRRWTAPVVDLDALAAGDPAVAAWAAALARPKVLVATQTRVLEPVVDVRGDAYPSVPVIAVLPRTTDIDGDGTDAGSRRSLDHLAAVLVAPPVSAWALREAGGTALSAGAIKVSARLLLEVPLPSDLDAWDAGAEAVRAAATAADGGDRAGWDRHLDRAAAVMTEAYGAGDEVLDWWRRRRPPWR